MIRILTRLLAGGTALIVPALAMATSAVAAMEPIRTDGMPIPMPKPDLALLYPAETVNMT